MIFQKYQIALLWTCQLLFMTRVFGQVYVAFYAPAWLPPMDEWYSGLIPYPILFDLQILTILLMTKISWDNTCKRGYFYVTTSKAKSVLVVISLIYFLIMAVRYVVTMFIFLERGWLGDTIPIFFHWVLAFYIYLITQDNRQMNHL